jgi:hypothetical protein
VASSYGTCGRAYTAVARSDAHSSFVRVSVAWVPYVAGVRVKLQALPELGLYVTKQVRRVVAFLEQNNCTLPTGFVSLYV